MNAALLDRARLAALIARLEQGLLERDTAVRLALLAALAGEHVLLIGPPGTAKSELARRLHSVFAGARYFERLLTRFSTPEELFGPLSLKALEHDRYERLVDGYLPTASIAFLDEVFKANSAILNALLTLLNEREFDNGSARMRTPLISVVGATNEVPAEEALMAFHDRFLLRVPVAGVSEAAFGELLTLAPAPAAPTARAEPIDSATLHEVIAARERVSLPANVVEALGALRGFVQSQGIVVSDRRWRQLVGLLRSAALTEGRDAVDRFDLWLVPYVVAAQPAQVPALQHWFVTEVAHAGPQDAPWLARAVEAFEKQLEIELSMPAEGGDDSAGKLALARTIGGANESGMLRIVTATLEDAMRRRWSPLHVAARLAQLDEVMQRAAEPLGGLRAQAAELQAALDGRIWLPPSLADTLQGNLQRTIALLDSLLARLSVAREGFAAMPQDDRLPQVEPEPLAIGA